MDLEKLKEFINFMNENNLSELEVEDEGKKIRLKKYSNESAVVIPQFSAPVADTSQNAPAKKDVKDGFLEIKSPMVGTFYRSPSPGSKAYVDIDEDIKPGEVVCIIEAMKLMNEIKAEIGGKVVDILVENGYPVEFGQPLFLIEPA